MVDVGWSHSLRLANDILNAGLKVYLLCDGCYKEQWLPKGVILLPSSPTSLERIVDSISAAVRAVSPDIILPVSEEILFRIWDEDPDWLPLVKPAIEPEHRELYRSKHLLGAFVKSHGGLIPETRLLENGTLEEISSITDDLEFPVVVKGAGGIGGKQVRIVESPEAAFQAVTELYNQTGAYPALQQFMTGATYLVGGLFDEGRPVFMIGAEKTEMYPPRTGPAIHLTSRDEPELIQLATTVFSALGLTGIASADFVRGRDGHFRFLEVNPRPWGSYGLAETIGIDLVGAWCRLLRKEYLPTVQGYPPNRAWAKMPDYIFVPPLTRYNMLRRAMHPLALSSWSWKTPRLLLFELRRAWWAFHG